jgi:hypothetical protein
MWANVAISADASLVAVTWGFSAAATGQRAASIYFLGRNCASMGDAQPLDAAVSNGPTSSPAVVRVTPEGFYAGVVYETPTEVRFVPFSIGPSSATPLGSTALPNCIAGQGHALGMNPTPNLFRALIGCVGVVDAGVNDIFLQTWDFAVSKSHLGAPTDAQLTIPPGPPALAYLVDYDAIGQYAVVGWNASNQAWGLNLTVPNITTDVDPLPNAASLGNDRILALSPSGDFILPVVSPSGLTNSQRVAAYGETTAAGTAVGLPQAAGALYRLDANGYLYAQPNVHSNQITRAPQPW